MKLEYKTIIAIIYTIVLFLDRLDLTIVNITFVTLAKYFNVKIIDTEAISVAFLVSLAIFIPISNYLSDRFGTKFTYIGAILCFGSSSCCIAISNNLNQIIILRFIQGIGGGILIPVGMTILYRLYKKEEYASITSYTFIPSLLAPAVAPAIGGILLDYFGWRAVFLVSGPICLLLGLTCIWLLKDDHYQNKRPFDLLGFSSVSSLLIITFYSLSLIKRNQLGWNFIILLFLIPIILIYFINIETKIKDPLIDLNLFKSKLFIKANLIQFGFQICHFGSIFLLGLYLQLASNISASNTGLIMGMQAVGAICVSRYSVKLYNKYNYKVPIIIGLSGIAIITPIIYYVDSSAKLTIGMSLFFIRGLFSGLCGTPIQTISIIDFNQQDIAKANTVFNITRQLSISFGIALFSILIAISSSLNIDHPTNFILSFIIVPIICLVTIIVINKG